MNPAEVKLLLYFMNILSDKLSSAGCNDMDQSVFKGIDPARMAQLKADYDEWDRVANPDGYEGPGQMMHIPDFCWVGFLKSRVRIQGE